MPYSAMSLVKSDMKFNVAPCKIDYFSHERWKLTAAYGDLA